MTPCCVPVCPRVDFVKPEGFCEAPGTRGGWARAAPAGAVSSGSPSPKPHQEPGAGRLGEALLGLQHREAAAGVPEHPPNYLHAALLPCSETFSSFQLSS